MAKRNVAFITGITGQDGSYLAEFLLAKGYEVHGLIRRSSTFNTSRIDHIYQDPHEKNPKLFLHYGDLIDGVGLTNLIREIKPTEVYNLGAQSHVQVSFTMPQYTGQVDAVGAVGLLEAIRSADIDTRFYQASTSELFGSTPPPQNELSMFRPQSPYAAALRSHSENQNLRLQRTLVQKLMLHHLVVTYLKPHATLDIQHRLMEIARRKPLALDLYNQQEPP